MLNRLKNALWLIVAAVVAVWAVTSLVGLVRAGPMEPPGPPGSTMKPLDEVEPRTAIWQPDAPATLPIVINQPGSYYLASNITGVSGENGIEISADNVTLDLNGFTLIGQPGSGDGVFARAKDNISIHDGTIRGWGGEGVFLAQDTRYVGLSNLRVVGNGGSGVTVGGNSTVSDCIVANNGGDGLSTAYGATVSGCTVTGNAGGGIYLGGDSVLADSTSSWNAGVGIWVDEGSVVEGCTAESNGLDGFDVLADGSVIRGNSASGNGLAGDGAGIHVLYDANVGRDNRIEGNNVAGNDVGIDVDNPGNIIIKNSARGNTTNYDIANGNAKGQIIDCTGAGGCTITADPWVNFRY